jgi:hypothetical protein
MALFRGLLFGFICVFLAALTAQAQKPQEDPYHLLSAPGDTQDTADEPLIGAFSPEAAAGYLDRRAHLVEKGCYACHSTFTYLPARSLIDPLADEVMRTRVLLEHLMTMLLDPKQASQVKTQHISRLRILAPWNSRATMRSPRANSRRSRAGRSTPCGSCNSPMEASTGSRCARLRRRSTTGGPWP